MNGSSARVKAELEHKMVLTNGVNLHVVQTGAADSDLVVLLHGFPEFWYGWHKQIDALVDAGFRIWIPDQRGYNLSEKPAGLDAYRVEELVRDVLGLIDAAGQQKAYIVGHDWGAIVAWFMALWYPERVEKLVIMNVPHPKIAFETIRSNPLQMLRSTYAGFFQIPIVPELLLTFADGMVSAGTMLRSSKPGTFTDADIAEYTRAWKQPGAMTAMLNWYRALAQRPPSFPDDVRVHIPTLMFWGKHDVALIPDMAQASIDLCGDGQLVFFEDATHWVQHEKAREINPRMIEFFAEGSSQFTVDSSQ